MLKSTKQYLSQGRIILASKSPRRQEILQKLGINVEIVPSSYNEDLDRSKYRDHGTYVEDLAYFKVQEVYERLKIEETPPSLIIGADTLVTIGNTIYGKPEDAIDAVRILSNLANREHIVYTGVCLKTPDKEIQFYESTQVKFGDISEEQIKFYVETGEPLDKAGGYGVQGAGGALIEKINGDFHTVMGLPLYSTVKRLNQLLNNI